MPNPISAIGSSLLQTCLLCGWLALCHLNGIAQLTPIAGVVNPTTSVTNIGGGNSVLTVSDPTAFALDDRILLMQMQGASIQNGNNSSFGTISFLNGAGSFEFGTVCNVDIGTNEITLQRVLTQSYQPTLGNVQLIRVATYPDARITGTLQAPAWNGSTGGVLVLEVADTLRLEADIDVAGQGFRGGTFTNTDPACNPLANGGYAFSLATGRGGQKGEGITAYFTNFEYGRGPQATGGGGGNDHNSGGAGGGNYGFGGRGGERVTGSFFCTGTREGEPGRGLSTFGYSVANPYIFLGGGGGVGQGNNNQGRDGGNGGGIILIRCGTFDGNGFTIRANGTNAADSDSDGGSGGGAAGSVLMEVTQYTPAAFSVEAIGGNGGSTSINCEGPGGGGSGGAIWSSIPFGGGVTRNVNGGTAGGANACGGNLQGAAPGFAGTELANFVFPEGTTTSPCVLSVEWLAWEGEVAEDQITLSWTVLETSAELEYELERAIEGEEFEPMHQQKAEGNSSIASYSWTDQRPWPGINRYRLRWRDVEGNTGLSETLEFRYELPTSFAYQLMPNPVRPSQTLTLQLAIQSEQRLTFRMINLHGQVLWDSQAWFSPSRTQVQIPVQGLNSGRYFLQIQGKNQLEIAPFQVH
ncbi:MAG: T9SS type A sorting domain-containing protein [Bacteroidota bacterium]